MEDNPTEKQQDDVGFDKLLGTINSLNDDQEIQDFVDARFNHLEANSIKKYISIVENERVNGSMTHGYINSESPIVTSFGGIEPFYMDDPSIYAEFVKSIKGKDMSNPLSIFHELQNFTVNKFGYKGDQQNRMSIYYDHEAQDKKISINAFYNNNSALCSERSAAVQNLASFMGIDCYMIFGNVSSSNNDKKIQHAYNIFKKDGALTLFDATNQVTLAKENSLGHVPAYNKLDSGIEVSDLTEIKFNLQQLSDIYNLPVNPAEPDRTYYTPLYFDNKQSA